MIYKRSKISTIFLVGFLVFPSLGNPAFAKSSSNASKAIALSYSGCTFGMLQWTSSKIKIRGIDFDASDIKSNLEMVVTYRMIDEDLLSPEIAKNYTEIGRIGYENVVQSFEMAGLLSKKWKSLGVRMNGLIDVTISQFRAGQTLGVARERAFAKHGQQAIAACKLAKQGVRSLARKNAMSDKQWILITAGDLLPPLHPAAKEIE